MTIESNLTTGISPLRNRKDVKGRKPRSDPDGVHEHDIRRKSGTRMKSVFLATLVVILTIASLSMGIHSTDWIATEAKRKIAWIHETTSQTDANKKNPVLVPERKNQVETKKNLASAPEMSQANAKKNPASAPDTTQANAKKNPVSKEGQISHLRLIKDTNPTRNEMGYVISVFSTSSYLCGAVMLAWALRDRDPRYDLVAVISGQLESYENYIFTKEVLQKVGYRVYDSPLLMKPNLAMDHKYLKYHYSKLNVFGLDDYKKLILVDVDYFFPNGAPDSLVAKYSGFPRPAGFTNCHCENEDDPINSGFLIFRPNQTLLSNMIANFDKIESYDEGDQGFIDQFFRTRRQGFEFIPDSKDTKFTSNFNRNGPVPRNYTAIHIFGSKPWSCPRGHHCASCSKLVEEKMMWPEVNNLWWEHYDAMIAAWPWMTLPKYQMMCISNSSKCVVM